MKKVSICIFALAFGAIVSNVATADVPALIPVQGVLADAADEPIDDLTDLTFTLYDDASGTTTLWTDTFVDVDVVEGFFTIYLGSNAALDFASLISNSEIWMGIEVETDGEMDRFQLAAVPFAVEALTAHSVGSLTETDINDNFMSSTYVPDWGDMTGIPGELGDGVDDVDDSVDWSEISGIVGTAADNVAAGDHNHDAAYSMLGHDHDADYSALGHDHDADYVSSSAPAAGITSTQVTNWDTAFGWGDHGAEGYLTSYTETDPVFVASPANGIVAGDITNWTTAFGWGDHSGLYSLVTHNHDTAYAALGHNHDAAYAAIGHDHDADYAAISHTHAWSTITGMPAGFADGVDNDSGGDITGVTAGWGLTGGGITGTVTVSREQSMSSCPSVYSLRATNLCMAGWRSPQTWGDAQADCFDEGAHVCTYAEFHYGWMTNGYDPGFQIGDWIGDIVGDDTALCVNNTTTSTNFEGHCTKNDSHWYRCCMGFGR